ncbi:unnamed protein product [Closterium sp. Naga37s-1]|nr:unnamed protein product [Closterium sp. Naga37s-1]
MDERLVQDWTTHMLVPFMRLLQDEGGGRKQALLVLDSYKGHLTVVPSSLVVATPWCNRSTSQTTAASSAGFATATALVLRRWGSASQHVQELVRRKAFPVCDISNAEDGSKDHQTIAHLRDKAEVEVPDDVQESEEGAEATSLSNEEEDGANKMRGADEWSDDDDEMEEIEAWVAGKDE